MLNSINFNQAAIITANRNQSFGYSPKGPLFRELAQKGAQTVEEGTKGGRTDLKELLARKIGQALDKNAKTPIHPPLETFKKGERLAVTA